MIRTFKLVITPDASRRMKHKANDMYSDIIDADFEDRHSNGSRTFLQPSKVFVLEVNKSNDKYRYFESAGTVIEDPLS